MLNFACATVRSNSQSPPPSPTLSLYLSLCVCLLLCLSLAGSVKPVWQPLLWQLLLQFQEPGQGYCWSGAVAVADHSPRQSHRRRRQRCRCRLVRFTLKVKFVHMFDWHWTQHGAGWTHWTRARRMLMMDVDGVRHQTCLKPARTTTATCVCVSVCTSVLYWRAAVLIGKIAKEIWGWKRCKGRENRGRCILKIINCI